MTNKIKFFKRLKTLSFSQQQLFATALCQRMYPNYQLFNEVSGFGDPKILDTILNLLWQSSYDHKLKFNIETHIEKLNTVTPEPKDFDIYGVYPAMDAAVALISVLSAIECKNEDDMINISKLSSSTVANYIEALYAEKLTDNLSTNAIDDFVFNHDVMLEEKELQLSLLEIIEENAKINADFVKSLRKEIIESSVSNIGICVN